MFEVGECVIWLWEHRGGWGYVSHVPAIVLKVGKSRIGIAAQAPLNTRDQSWMPRWIKPGNLRRRN